MRGSSQPLHAPVVEQLQKRTTAIVLVTVVATTMINSMLSGVTTVALPMMARDLNLAPSVLLWYEKRTLSVALY